MLLNLISVFRQNGPRIVSPLTKIPQWQKMLIHVRGTPFVLRWAKRSPRPTQSSSGVWIRLRTHALSRMSSAVSITSTRLARHIPSRKLWCVVDSKLDSTAREYLGLTHSTGCLFDYLSFQLPFHDTPLVYSIRHHGGQHRDSEAVGESAVHIPGHGRVLPAGRIFPGSF